MNGHIFFFFFDELLLLLLFNSLFFLPILYYNAYLILKKSLFIWSSFKPNL